MKYYSVQVFYQRSNSSEDYPTYGGSCIIDAVNEDDAWNQAVEHYSKMPQVLFLYKNHSSITDLCQVIE